MKLGLHTLILLDLNPKDNKFLKTNDALNYLLKNDIKLKLIVCSCLGTGKQIIKYDDIKKLKKINFKLPACIIIPGKLHFIEEEMLNSYK